MPTSMWDCAEKSWDSRSETAILSNLVCKVGPGLAPGNWDSQVVGGGPHLSLTDKRVLLWLNCLGKQYCLCWPPVFLPGVWNLGTWQTESGYVNGSQYKSLGTEFLVNFPGWPYFNSCYHNWLLEEVNASTVLPLERLLETCPAFPRHHPERLSPLWILLCSLLL